MTAVVAYGEFIVPEAWNMPAFVGVFVGGCVERGIGSSFRRMAHAHNQVGDHRYGWVCVRSPKRVITATGRPTVLMFHEYAHLLTPNQGHSEGWGRRLAALGWPAEARRCSRAYRVWADAQASKARRTAARTRP